MGRISILAFAAAIVFTSSQQAWSQNLSARGRVTTKVRVATPWYADPNIQQDLQLSSEQIASLQATGHIGAFHSPQQQARYQQFVLQYQGAAAFSDPRVQQRLRLSGRQSQQLYQLGLRTSGIRPMGILPGDEDFLEQLRHTRGRVNEQVNALMSNRQRSIWSQMIGEPFSFSQ